MGASCEIAAGAVTFVSLLSRRVSCYPEGTSNVLDHDKEV